MPARSTKIRHDEETRAKIQAAQIINRLYKGFNGDVELTRTQVSIGMGLLAKVLPDLSAVSLDASVEHDVTDTLAQLIAQISAGGKRLVP